jgi:hypothetical protein
VPWTRPTPAKDRPRRPIWRPTRWETSQSSFDFRMILTHFWEF